MSKIREILELKPDHGCTNGRRDEQFVSKGYDCPECNGNGWHWAEDGKDYVKAPCHVCKGTGKVDAVVTVHWQASEGRSKV